MNVMVTSMVAKTHGWSSNAFQLMVSGRDALQQPFGLVYKQLGSLDQIQ